MARGECLISNRETLTAEKEADIPGHGVPVCLLRIIFIDPMGVMMVSRMFGARAKGERSRSLWVLEKP